MRDALGNRIEIGTLLYWLKLGTPVKVTNISDGGLSLASARELSPAILAVEIQFAIDVTKLPSGAEPQVPDFIRIVDPKQDAMLERLTGGKTQ